MIPASSRLTHPFFYSDLVVCYEKLQSGATHYGAINFATGNLEWLGCTML